MVNELIHNYKIKLNDLLLLRESLHSVGDELPAGILKLAKVYIAKNVSWLGIKWLDVTVTKVLLLVSS
jgi:hypothetical protein